jgi:hypothetical protein
LLPGLSSQSERTTITETRPVTAQTPPTISQPFTHTIPVPIARSAQAWRPIALDRSCRQGSPRCIDMIELRHQRPSAHPTQPEVLALLFDRAVLRRDRDYARAPLSCMSMKLPGELERQCVAGAADLRIAGAVTDRREKVAHGAGATAAGKRSLVKLVASGMALTLSVVPLWGPQQPSPKLFVFCLRRAVTAVLLHFFFTRSYNSDTYRRAGVGAVRCRSSVRQTSRLQLKVAVSTAKPCTQPVHQTGLCWCANLSIWLPARRPVCRRPPVHYHQPAPECRACSHWALHARSVVTMPLSNASYGCICQPDARAAHAGPTGKLRKSPQNHF